MRCYVIVHGGAGEHSKNSEPEVKKALRLACTQVLNSAASSENGKISALDLVERAIVSLEDSPLLNAGYGSNLTLSGTVECDASLMDGLTADFGSVGAVSGIKNPIRLARRILEHARVPDPLGRIPPLTLVSTGAYAFAQVGAAESLVTPRAKKQWERWKARLDSGSSASSSSSSTSLSAPIAVDIDTADDEDLPIDALQDTVGALAFIGPSAENAQIASGVSSGGILLKHPGRIGEAAVFGAGCWAQAPESTSTGGRRRRMGMACSVSGAGEYIVRANLARSIADALNKASDAAEDVDVDVHEVLQRVLAEEFWIPSRSPSNPDPSAGVILLTIEEDEDGELTARLWCAFTTPSMAIAYATSENPNGKALILRRPTAIESRANDRPRIFVTGFSF
ncbi:asparaginase [Mycena leptocephala]|nr:asparaginase [Mycena leptocephala]